MSFADFMRVALYDPEFGYYRQPRQRVGRGPGTDFFTATSSGPIFGELIEAAAASLLPAGKLSDYTFVEIGAEPAGGIMSGRHHGFRDVRLLPLGAPLAIAGPCVVFSNELFDAQPFRRFVRRAGSWRELGVALEGEALQEVELEPSPEAGYLPASAPEEYHLDAPEAAVTLLEEVCAQDWDGLFLACDYGKTWAVLSTEWPAGTARAYSQHQQSNDLLAQPGQQDLTCHICWDWMEAALRRHGFEAPCLESQEAFFVHHAADFMARTVAEEARQFSKRKLALMQLVHPSHLGDKFQVLHAARTSAKVR